VPVTHEIRRFLPAHTDQIISELILEIMPITDKTIGGESWL